jgi:hypothetical protein
MSDDIEEQIETLVTSGPAISSFSLENVALRALITDLAQQIYSTEEICERYGMTKNDLWKVLQIPAILLRVREQRAIWTSGASIQDRIRAHFGIVALESAPVLDKMIHNTNVGVREKIDAIKEVSKNAGIVSGNNLVQSGGGAMQFAVNIIFSDGKEASITTVGPPAPIIEGEAA